QHLGDVACRDRRRRELEVLLPVNHVQPLSPGDAAALIARSPVRGPHRLVDVDTAFEDGAADQGVGDRLRYRPRDEAALGAEAVCVALGHEPAAFVYYDGAPPTEKR